MGPDDHRHGHRAWNDGLQTRTRHYLQVLSEIGNIQEDMPNLRWSRYHHAVYTGDLIPGCRLCMRHAFCCVHLGLRCNLTCPFCPWELAALTGSLPGQDADLRQKDLSAFHAQNRRRPVEGVSLSGGEPFLYLDELERCCQSLLAINPEMHLWVYTNGLLATGDTLRRVRGLGIREIRFNLAATGFGETTMRNLALARDVFEYVAVEIPVFPKQRRLLLDSLERLDAIGIDQLNLQELVVSPANISRLGGEVYSVGGVTLLYGSRKLSYEVIRRSMDRGFRFTCVDCSAGVKHMMDQGSPLGF